MNELQTILSDSVNGLLSERVTKDLVQKAEEGEWPDALWNEIETNGLTRVLVPEAQGGAGATWADAAIVLKAAGEHVAPVPLAEAVLANWLLAEAGIGIPDGVVTLLDGDFKLQGGTLSGRAEGVPWGRSASYGVAVLGDAVALVPLAGAAIEPGINVAREPRDRVTLEAAAAVAKPAELPRDALMLYGALIRSCQMAGALGYLSSQSVAYANERTQFGKPIGKFQAIQQQLAVLSTQAAASGIAADYACAQLDKRGSEAAFEIAVAKIRTDDASSIATSIAHQVHGAIGFTYEHGLHFATRRLWSWRAEFGAGAEWAERLGRETISRGADALWPYTTAR
ncbi:acyl-CoA dehydrogenase domain protein [Parvibaculum lavamentivorans DS-1]|uniref:Acyl-CoA dehydrogenase domain protein n=1 Tax=Parvibaculum lavamentivorans (strain DS-1 / DSM 13023 / NCIMB 13966) TaxID=402881 RepID=A7HRL5_PARL1|nr:acyl-CoA dehydrogenase family protein [Parvibaculum lavamentivorans]ABS62548.1 acyl-CoA dehydrogenase domain protein [Parvibaculum lavamentivorans DS-1]